MSTPRSFARVTLAALTLFAVVSLVSVDLSYAKKKSGDKASDTEEGEEKDKWDVDNPPGEHYEIELDTDEGTWMSLDVSPDGEEIVFDLLGDLYTIPIGGGDATALTSGFAWDMQPRYSPDGESIAFTSDRGGGDNI